MGAKRVETRARKRNRQTESRKKKGVERDREREEEGGGREIYRSRQTDKHTGERREIERGEDLFGIEHSFSRIWQTPWRRPTAFRSTLFLLVTNCVGSHRRSR